MRAVSGVNEDLVVSVSLPLHLLGAVGPWGLRFTAGRSTTKSVHNTQNNHAESQAEMGILAQTTLPVRHGRGDVSIIEAGVPWKQDDASVAKHAVEKQLGESPTTTTTR